MKNQQDDMRALSKLISCAQANAHQQKLSMVTFILSMAFEELEQELTSVKAKKDSPREIAK